MGTTYNISLVVKSSNSITTDELKLSVDRALSQIDKAMSTYKTDSEISHFNRLDVGLEAEVSASTEFVISEAIRLNEYTQGAFDITIAPLVDLWGFGGGSKEYGQVVPEKQIQDSLKFVGMDRFQLRSNRLFKVSGVKLDLSAIAKGYAVDQVAEILSSYGVDRYLVEVGGEVVTKGNSIRNSSWVLGIESPDKSGRSVYTMIHLNGEALATSGDYRNYFEVNGKKFSHTIDPFTGMPVKHQLASVSVVADNCMLADGLATALMVMGEDKGYRFAQKHGISAFFIYRDGARLLTRHTNNFEQYMK